MSKHERAPGDDAEPDSGIPAPTRARRSYADSPVWGRGSDFQLALQHAYEAGLLVFKRVAFMQLVRSISAEDLGHHGITHYADLGVSLAGMIDAQDPMFYIDISDHEASPIPDLRRAGAIWADSAPVCVASGEDERCEGTARYMSYNEVFLCETCYGHSSENSLACYDEIKRRVVLPLLEGDATSEFCIGRELVRWRNIGVLEGRRDMWEEKT